MQPGLTILGGSTRAAAESALRAGFQPTCYDFFADADLREIADVRTFRDMKNLQRKVRGMPAQSWVFTGGLENHPSLLADVARRNVLQGTNPANICRLRDPFDWHDTLTQAGLPALPILPGDTPADDARLAPPHDWLVKPLAGCGGQGIRVRTPTARTCRNDASAKFYFQRQLHGQSFSATCLADDHGDTVVLGCCLHGNWQAGLGASAFGWCGGVGPVTVPAWWQQKLENLAEVLTAEYRLRGLFGLDVIADGEHVWLLEINPRYTGTIELLELASRTSLLAAHVRTCEGERLRDLLPLPTVDQQQAGSGESVSASETRLVWKVIPYAPMELLITQDLRDAGTFRKRFTHDENGTFPDSGSTWIADCPMIGSRVPAGFPVCSVLCVMDGLTSSESGDVMTFPSDAVPQLNSALAVLRESLGVTANAAAWQVDS